MKKTPALLFLFFMLALPASAQDYAVSHIPEVLKAEAYAVVRESYQSYEQTDVATGSYKKTIAITVFDKRGDRHAHFGIYEDAFDELRSFSGEIYNESGKQIKKISKKDLFTTAISSNLASSGKHTIYQVYSPVYPYTVKYTYELRVRNGILSYNAFSPCSASNLALEKAEYTLLIPKDIKLRYRAANTDIQPEVTAEKGKQRYTFRLENIPALPYERFAPQDELFPYVLLAPDHFCVEGVCGDMSNWEAFGQWTAGLLKGRSSLPQKTIDKVKELTVGISDKREQAKILYEYMQANTHYVSIQLGIGGWQPLPAQEVANTGFGDCKGLSNYMKALLEVVDIPSYYTVISTNHERLYSDYPSFTQANHVILMIPFEQDSLWLECTNQSLPFGYIHSNIAGHDALAVNETEAFFCTLPAYPDKDQKEINKVDVLLEPNGDASLHVASGFYLSDFEYPFFRMRNNNANEQNDYLASLVQTHKPQVSNVRKEEHLSGSPAIDLYYTIDCEDYASQTGSRLFVPVNPARTAMNVMLPGTTRRFDILFSTVHNQYDTIRIQIPQGYKVESLPKEADMDTKYGLFRSSIVVEDDQVVYTQTLELHPGRYPAAEFNEIKTFFNQIDGLQSGKVGFVKQ